MVCHFLLQGIFLTQGLNPHLCLLHCRRILLPLSHRRNPLFLELSLLMIQGRLSWLQTCLEESPVAFPFSRGSSQPRDLTQVSCIAGGFFTNWAMTEQGFNPWVRKIPWRRKWQPTPGLLPGKFHGWRNLVGYSPEGHKELDTTE